MQTLRYRLSPVFLLIGLTTFAPGIDAKDKKLKTPPPAPIDQIQVVGHIPLTDGPVKRFLVTQHYSSYYLYAEHDSGKSVTLIDVTKINRPSILADVAYTPGSGQNSMAVVEPAAGAPVAPPQTVRIMDFSDPRNPKVAREFANVTAMSRDERRGLIFIANADGIWILQQRLAEDPEVEKAYANYVLYSH
jgi:hypothetical protein